MSLAKRILEMTSVNESESSKIAFYVAGSEWDHGKIGKVMGENNIKYKTRKRNDGEEYVINRSDMKKVQRIADSTNGEFDYPIDVRFIELNGLPIDD